MAKLLNATLNEDVLQNAVRVEGRIRLHVVFKVNADLSLPSLDPALDELKERPKSDVRPQDIFLGAFGKYRVLRIVKGKYRTLIHYEFIGPDGRPNCRKLMPGIFQKLIAACERIGEKDRRRTRDKKRTHKNVHYTLRNGGPDDMLGTLIMEMDSPGLVRQAIEQIKTFASGMKLTLVR